MLKLPPAKRKEIASATLVATLGVMVGCFGLLGLCVYASDPVAWNDPTWWSSPGTGSQGAVVAPQVVTNKGVVTTNYIANNNAVVTQGQLKQFTARAVDELNANLTNGAGTALSNLAYDWKQDYATNNYSSTNNPTAPYKPSDLDVINVGQLKYVGNLIWGRLVTEGYTNQVPAWLSQNTNTDNVVANIGQLKEVFDFDPLLDSDGSGLPISWENEYFGHTGVDPSAIDGNGLTNLESYQYGLDPTSSNSIDSNGISYVWEVQNFGAVGIDPYYDPSGSGYPAIYRYTHNVSASATPTADFVVDAGGSTSYRTIASALAALTKDYQIITVKPGTYQESPSISSHKVLIRSTSGAASTILDGRQSSGAYLYKDTFLEGFTFTNDSGYSIYAAIYNNVSPALRVDNCVFYGNNYSTGAFYVSSVSLTAVNCTVFNNTIDPSDYAIYSYNSTIKLINTIMWDGGQEINPTQNGITATYCDIQGSTTYTGIGNINSNPLLRNDGHLSVGSPCIDIGTATGAPNFDMDNESRPGGSGYDIGADEYIDTNGNGLPDWWQNKYFGELGVSPSALSPNADQQSNLTNYQQQINPVNPIDTNGISYAWEVQYFGQLHIDPYGDANGNGYPNIYKYTHNVSSTGVPTPDFVVDAGGSTSYRTIQSAINATTKDFQIIAVKPGTYAEEPDIYNYRVLIRATNGASTTILNGRAGEGATVGKDTVIENLTLTNDYGSGVYVGTTTNDGLTVPVAVRFENVVFVGNNVSYGIFENFGGSIIATNCSLFDNTIPTNDYALYNSSGTISLKNSVLWNGPNEINPSQTGVTATYCDVQGTALYAGTGNINANPEERSDGHIFADSPCIGAGTANGAPTFDMDNEPRPSSAGFDIGADEYVDTNGNGMPDWWQLQYFGALGVSPTADSPNGDQQSNLTNYQQQLDPINPIDTNGISYAWELQNFSQLHIDPYGDANGNGYPNIYKYTHNVSATGTPASDFVVDAAGSTSYSTIQSALNATSKDYQIITVLPGTYNERPAISNYKTLVRSSNGAVSTIINEGQNDTFTVNKDAVIDNFTITNSYYGAVSVNTPGVNLYLTNDLFTNNVATSSGGIVYGAYANVNIINCTFFNNMLFFSAPDVYTTSGTTQYGFSSSLKLLNTILWDGGNEISSTQTNVTAAYCDIEGTSTFTGTGNVNVDPQLWPDGHLGKGSPAIGAGTGTGAIDRDMDNEARPFNGNYDIGADEYVDSQNIGIPDWWQNEYFGHLIAASLVTSNGATAGEDFQYQINPTSTNTIDSNGISYAWENEYFGQIRIDPSADPNSVGVSNYLAYTLGINPTAPPQDSVDTDGDGVPDYQDYYPNDPTRWLNLPDDPNDHTAPVIQLTAPSYATPQP